MTGSDSQVPRLAATAEALLRAGRTVEAIDAYRALLAADPARPDDWYNLGYLQRVARRFDEALASYGEALARGVRRPEEVRLNRAAILSEQLLQRDAAEAELIEAVRIAPRFVSAWHNLGQLREDHDDRTGARETYASVLATAPDDGRAHARLAAMDVFDGKAAEVIGRLRAPLARMVPGPDAAELRFAMANALDAVGDYPAAFAAAVEANALAGRASPLRYDPAAQDREIARIIERFPAAAPGGSASTRPRPVFVCGMFRSGSTLCEQVLARHSRVTAGGELEALPALAQTSRGDAMSVAELRARYLGEVGRLFPDADVLTDKRPDNFMHIGLIKATFPDAVIVHTVRNPLDTMLSTWFLYFADSVAWSSDMRHIVHFWRGYRRLMAHWTVLHPDIVTFDYDAFVADPVGRARALIEACGLEWEEGCDPHRPGSGAVRTASTWQVRQPVHGRSSGRWRNYAAQLESLRAEIERQ